MVTYFIISSISAVAWFVGLGLLLYLSLNTSDRRSSHQAESFKVFLSAFGRAVFIPSKVGNSALEINVARVNLIILAVFFASFYQCVMVLLGLQA